jgi:hypothetical protein
MRQIELNRAHFFKFLIFSVICVAMLSIRHINISSDTDAIQGVVNTTYQIDTSLALGDATIVTAYFEFHSKHTSSEFIKWMKNMLSLQDPMIIFTTEDKEDMFYRMREHALNRTFVVVMNLHDAEVVRLYGMDFWYSQHNIDPEKNVNVNPLLYIIWNEKLEFVKKSINLNPFNSSHFLWMDVGFLRHNLYNGELLVKDKTPFTGDKVLMLDITKMTNNLFHQFTKNENKVGAGIFGGSIAAMERYHDEYYRTLSIDISKSRFVGVEQIEMWRTCEKNPNLCYIITMSPFCGEAWRFCFHLMNHLHSIVDGSFIAKDSEIQSPWFYLVPFLIDRLWLTTRS